MNKHIIIGNVGQEPEIKNTETIKIANFSVACNKYRKDKETNEMIQDTDWIKCVAFGLKAELIEKFVKKGDRISLVGRVSPRSYQDKENQTKYITETIIDEIEFLSNKNEERKLSDPLEGLLKSEPKDDLPF